MENGDREK